MPLDDLTYYANTTDYDYDDNGNLTKVTLPNGVYLEYSYDSAQRLPGSRTRSATPSPTR